MSWLEIAASVPGFIGFAMDRTNFLDAVADYEANTVTLKRPSPGSPIATANR